MEDKISFREMVVDYFELYNDIINHLCKKKYLRLIAKVIMFIPFTIMFFMAIACIIGFIGGVIRDLKKRQKYHVVIKKGLLWDTEYLIERDKV